MGRFVLLSAFFILFVATGVAIGAGFDVGGSKASIAKATGDVVLFEKGKKIASPTILNSEFRPGSYINIGPKSEVWVKVDKNGSGEPSYLRFSTAECSSRCTFSESGLISNVMLKEGSACKKSLSIYDKAREVAGVPKLDAKTEEIAPVTFVDSNTGKGDDTPPGTGATNVNVYDTPPGIGSTNVNVYDSSQSMTNMAPGYVPGGSIPNAGTSAPPPKAPPSVPNTP